MALADFTFVKENTGGGAANAAKSIEPSNPIQGVGSGAISLSGNETDHWMLSRTAGLNKNCVYGRVLYQPRVSSDIGVFGIFLQMQATPGDLDTACYFAQLERGAGGTSHIFGLGKGSLRNALAGAGYLSVANVTNPAVNATCAMALRCEYNASGGGNVLLTAYFDEGPIVTPVVTDYDFPGLVQKAQFNDTSSPYVTGTWGVYGSISSSPSIQVFQIFDELWIQSD